MTALNTDEQAENLRKFFADGTNSVTRERIFFNRLSFDLKIAAARAGYHLHLYEPDVDRDGFDIVMEDGDHGIGWFQTKAVLSSAATSTWKTNIDFIRPPHTFGDAFDFEPVECGRGGGVILIEIDDTTSSGSVKYYYTDFRILIALAERYLVEMPIRRRGRPSKKVQQAAETLVKAIRLRPRSDPLDLPRAAFVELMSADGLLALMGLRNSEDFGAYSVHQAYSDRVAISDKGVGVANNHRSISALSALHWHMEKLAKLLDGKVVLKPFTFQPPDSILK
ncbi:MAG: hypothetical protein INF79_06260 [Roseomonas sp.]|nr:hypothetical protein [Roseomonas sp.]